MSPLILVGILISTAVADVSHVLSGAAHPPANSGEETNFLSLPKNAFQTGNPQDFWWMAPNSPLKEAYDYFKKCSSKGNCLPPLNLVSEVSGSTNSVNAADDSFGPINVKNNPFLSGAFPAGSFSSATSFASSGCTACTTGSKAGGGSSGGGGGGGGGISAFHSGTKIDISNNPFLNGQFAIAGNGEKVRDINGFLGVQPKKPGFATSHPLSNKQPFATSPPSRPQSFILGKGVIEGIECRGRGAICVAKDQCINGVVRRNIEDGLLQVRNDVQYCNADSEVCCRLSNAPETSSSETRKATLASTINNLAEVSAGKSSVTGSPLKFAGGPGSSPGQIQVLIDQPFNIKPLVSHAGESGSQSSSTAKPTRDTTPSANSAFFTTADYSNVHFDSDVRFASTIQGPAYLPPVGVPPSSTTEAEQPPSPSIITYQPSVPTTPRPIISTPRLCPAGTFLAPSGICESPRTPTPLCPIGTVRSPDGSCKRLEIPPTSEQCPPGILLTAFGTCEVPTAKPVCPIGTIQSSDGGCIRPPPSPRPCPAGTFLTTSGLCESPNPPRPLCPYGTIQRPDGSCEGPSTPITPISCPPGTVLTASGLCEAQRPPCPFGTIQRPDGSCERPTPSPTPRPCPPGTFLTSSGSCESPLPPTPRPSCSPGTVLGPTGLCEYPIIPSTTIGYEYSKPCPPGTFKTPAGLCERPIVTTPRPQCPFGTFLTFSGSCEAPTRPSTPKQPPTPFETTTSREYLPPAIPTQPNVTPSPSDGYNYYTPTPTLPLIPISNNINNQYIPAPTTYLPPETSERTGSNIKTATRLPSPSPPPPPPPTPDRTGQSVNLIPVKVPPNRPPLNVEQNSPPVGCAAALKCVQEIYCTAEGFVSPVPVVLTKEQELLRAPTTECKDLESGIIGKCCRDPNYKDPWPSANLVNGVDDGQYKEDNFYGQRELLGNRLVRAPNATASGGSRPARNLDDDNKKSEPICGARHHNTKPLGPGPLDANFAEYPWQAMILRDSNRSLLCGGAIIRRNAVLTAAHCVEGLDTSDVLIKGGEWKLGIDEEPLPFQIVKVAAILRHPDYKVGSYKNDIAILVLQEKLRPSKNVGTICLPPPNQAPSSKCVVTGWGKRILQLHARGAIMHHINVEVINGQQCQQTLQQNFQDALRDYNGNTLCGVSNIDQCKVDYGSALACSDDQDQYTLHGVYAWDTGCKQEEQIGGYVAPDVEWIDSTLEKPLKDLKRIEKEYLLKSSSK